MEDVSITTPPEEMEEISPLVSEVKASLLVVPEITSEKVQEPLQESFISEV
jgi:hypothetical protein